jgi:hypothetical protein
MSDNKSYKFTQIYRMPGEGLIAEFRRGEQTLLFGLDGLQYRLLELRAAGSDTREEEKALAILNNLGAGQII